MLKRSTYSHIYFSTFRISKKKEWPMCLSASMWVKNMYRCTVEYYAAMNRTESYGL